MELGRHAEPEPGPLRILTVCTANICRSPAAERLLQAGLDEAGIDAEVSSAGVKGFRDAPMDDHAAAALRQVGGDDTGFRSRPLTGAHVRDADLVLTATLDHRGAVLGEHPRGLRKSFTLTEFAHLSTELAAEAASPDELIAAAFASRGSAAIDNYDIDDPYGSGDDQHQRTVAEIKQATDAIVTAFAQSRQ